MRRSIYSLFLVLFITTGNFAQPRNAGAPQQLAAYQDSLQRLGFQVVNNPSETERYNANYKMIKTLVSALRLHNSFNFAFDSLKTISIQTSPDHSFRIFSWHVLNNDGSYRFYGTIQMSRGSDRLQMYPLVDHTSEIKNPADTVLSNDRWYGAQYYKIVPVTYNVKTPYYVLLGWKGNNPKSTKKVIDILYFKNDKAFFGLPVFEGSKAYAGKHRIVFEYSRQVSMLLNYLPREEMIVFDHLASPSAKTEGKAEFYGPDLTYDGLKLERGRWKFLDNMELKNPPSQNDNLYIDPKKAPSEVINKLK